MDRCSRRVPRVFVAAACALALSGCAPLVERPRPAPTGPITVEASSPPITAKDLDARIAALTDPRTEGRGTGTPGEAAAADWLARAFVAAGLVPAGDAWEHVFEFTAGVSLGPDNRFEVDGAAAELDRDWRPLAFSRAGAFEASDVVFVGYGLVAPAAGDAPAHDDFGDVDVRDRWVLVLRDLPQTLDADRRRALRRHAGLRYKAMIARDRGARGVLFASGPLGRFREELVPLRFDASLAGTSIATLSLSDALAEKLLVGTGRSLEAWQQDAGAAIEDAEGHAIATRLEATRVGARIDLQTERRTGRNVVGRLVVGAEPSVQTIVIGAHYDHLGRGQGAGSLARPEEAGAIHPGADDNASGTAVVVELAESLAARRARGENIGHRDFVFAAWSGEELGLLGSDAWVGDHVNPHEPGAGPVAYLNFDMVGRLRDALVVQGLGSSPDWTPLVEETAERLGLPVETQQDSYVPTDATSFYTHGVPVLSAFTGVHGEYHTPRDTQDLLNLEGAARIAQLFEDLALAIGGAERAPEYQAQKDPAAGRSRGGFRVYLGTIPDYANTDVVGVLLSGVAPEGPAARAGLRRGDLIVGADDRTIENLYDYTFALEAMRIGEPVRLRVLRDGEPIELELVPGSRD